MTAGGERTAVQLRAMEPPQAATAAAAVLYVLHDVMTAIARHRSDCTCCDNRDAWNDLAADVAAIGRTAGVTPNAFTWHDLVAVVERTLVAPPPPKVTP